MISEWGVRNGEEAFWRTNRVPPLIFSRPRTNTNTTHEQIDSAVKYQNCSRSETGSRSRVGYSSHPQNSLSCKSFSAKEPLIIWIFCGKYLMICIPPCKRDIARSGRTHVHLEMPKKAGALMWILRSGKELVHSCASLIFVKGLHSG